MTAQITVLVADDDDDFRDSIVEIVNSAGYKVLEARDGAEALALAREHNPEILVIDYRMPKLSGADVVLELQRSGITPRILFVTASSDVQKVAAGLGIACYLGKPFGLDEFLNALTRAARLKPAAV